ncbi:MAG: 2-amino-4-hydroxy-6-hydroxymethyldihydropteridine diphosphokinase [Planctomycetota bacterium]|nr:MAG: 2-amino-4-hydroxy-6-hydroxymethyldihydropteridine diphosphokinase [Planctomycetota bacterium]
MANVLIALGSNLGDSTRIVRDAIAHVVQNCEIASFAASRLHQTRPVGGPTGQGAFVNAALAGDTSLSPQAVLKRLQAIETQFGRERLERWGPRTLDLDLILYDDWIEDEPGLTVPHPRMAWRRFVLEPAAEVAPRMVHPIFERCVAELKSRIDATTRPRVVVWADTLGEPGERREAFLSRLAKRLDDSAVFEVQTLESVEGSARHEKAGHAGVAQAPNLYIVGPAVPNPLYRIGRRRYAENAETVGDTAPEVGDRRGWTQKDRISCIVQRYRTTAPILVLPHDPGGDLGEWEHEIVAAVASMR